MSKQQNTGWVWGANMRQPHYIIAGRSLCGRWGWLGRSNSDDPETPPGAVSPCKGCYTKWRKLAIVTEKP